jgi:hypothetical protein
LVQSAYPQRGGRKKIVVHSEAPDHWSFRLKSKVQPTRMYEESGDLPRALATIRRRAFDNWPDPVYMTVYREEGRLAALNGDREGAIRAYRRYLALRSRPEPRLQPQVAQVRADLQALERESTDR